MLDGSFFIARAHQVHFSCPIQKLCALEDGNEILQDFDFADFADLLLWNCGLECCCSLIQRDIPLPLLT